MTVYTRLYSGVSFPVCENEFCPAFGKKFALDESQ